MQDLLEKIYHSVISNEEDSIRLGEEYARQMEEILEPLKERFTEDEIDEIREQMYDVSKLHLSFGEGIKIVVLNYELAMEYGLVSEKQ